MRVVSSAAGALRVLGIGAGVVLLAAASSLFGLCGPFTDVTDATFCPFVLEIFTLGITTGTSPTTYAPGDPVSRLQMAAFLSRTVDGVLKRGSRRAIMNKFWTPQNALALALTTVGSSPNQVTADRSNVWVTSGSTVARVLASDGRLLETWTGAAGAGGILAAMGRILVTGGPSPGMLYRIDPSQLAGAVTTVASNLGQTPGGIAFDGGRFWTANETGSVSIVVPGATIPWTVATVTTGFVTPTGVLFDGGNVWVTDSTPGTLLKLNAAGAVLQTVTLGLHPAFPVFDGSSIWVPNRDSVSVTVVRASSGAVLATLTGNGLAFPFAAAFDGERVLVTNGTGDSVSLFKAADLTSLGSVSTGAGTKPLGVCADRFNFWIALGAAGSLARF